MSFEEGRRIAELLAIDQAGLDAHIDADAAWVRKWLIEEPRTGFRPQLSIQVKRSPSGPIEILPALIDCDFNESEEKRAILFALGRRIYQDRLWPVSAVLASEAWGAPESSSSGVQPRHHPERREVIVLFGMTLVERRTASRIIDVTRGPGNVIVPAAETEAAGPGSSSPLLCYFFEGYFEAAAKGMTGGAVQ